MSKSKKPGRKESVGGAAKAASAAKKNGRRSAPRDNEERIDRYIRSSVGTGAEDYAPEDWRSMREEWRLNALYPGRVVAFLDHRDELGMLVLREILCSARSLEGLHVQLAKLPEEQQDRVQITHVEKRNGENWIGGLWFESADPLPAPTPDIDNGEKAPSPV